MRYLRIAAILIFAVSAVLNIGAALVDSRNHDSTVPEITSSIETLEISVQSPPEELLSGLTAYDGKDGDLTDKIMVAGVSRFLENSTCRVKYVVFDSNRNSASFTRDVRYTDYESPKFALSEPLVYARGENISFLERVSVTDDLDGDITDKIRVTSGSISNYEVGAYPVELEVSNSYGDRVSIELNVVVEDGSMRPKVELSDYIVYVKAGSAFDPDDYITRVRDAEGYSLGTGSVQISGSVDTGTPGCYQLVYSATSDGQTGRAYLTVVVTGEEA